VEWSAGPEGLALHSLSPNLSPVVRGEPVVPAKAPWYTPRQIPAVTDRAAGYDDKLAREARHWGDRLSVESRERHAWLDHPVINQHYQQRALVDGLPWPQWVTAKLGRPVDRSYELGCGSAGRSLQFYDAGVTHGIEGSDVSPDRIAVGERERLARRAPGGFVVEDANRCALSPSTYDLIFSCHSFHHFEALEHVMAQVHEALTPEGVFVLEEFVGPTQFQWTDRQIAITRELTHLLPEPLRTFRWDAVKTHEGRPTPAQVVAVSPFESIRSGEIAPLFHKVFDVVTVRPLGGTIQHLLYNGIVHNFRDEDLDARRMLQGICRTEDALIDAGLLPSDFQLLVGRRRQR
jgi:SAM-dependent methyltransferase